MSKMNLVEDDFKLEDDEEEVKVIKKTKKKVAKKKPVKAPPSLVVSVRLPVETATAVENSGVKVADAFKAFCEKEFIHKANCPTCGHELKKKK